MSVVISDVKQYLTDRTSGRSGNLTDDAMDRAIIHGVRALAEHYQWSFFRKTTQLVTTAEYDTGTVDLTHGSAAVAGTGTTFVAGHAGQLLIPSTQNRGYTIDAYNSATSLTLEAPFIADDAADDSGVSYRIVYRDVDLPSDFREVEECFLSGDRAHDRLLATRQDKIDEAWALEANSGTPQHYSVFRSVSSGTDSYTLRLYPASDKAKALTMVYHRWPTEPDVTSDAATFDWPDKYRELLYAACLRALSEDIFPELRSVAQTDFNRSMNRAMNDDRSNSPPLYLGGDRRRAYGNRIILVGADRG